MQFIKQILEKIWRYFRGIDAVVGDFTFRYATEYDLKDFPRLEKLVPKSHFVLRAKEKMEMLLLEDSKGLPFLGVLFWKADLLEPYLQLAPKHKHDRLFFFEFTRWGNRGKYFYHFQYLCAMEHFKRHESRLLLLEDRLQQKEKRALRRLGYIVAKKGVQFNTRSYDLYAIEKLGASTTIVAEGT